MMRTNSRQNAERIENGSLDGMRGVCCVFCRGDMHTLALLQGITHKATLYIHIYICNFSNSYSVQVLSMEWSSFHAGASIVHPESE